MNSRSRHTNDLSLSLPDYHHTQYHPSTSSSQPPLHSPPILTPNQNPWAQSQSLHRTSNSREELHPLAPSHQPLLLPRQDHHPQIKHELRDSSLYSNSNSNPNSNQPPSQSQSQQQQPPNSAMEDSMPSTSDFVKKLYKMLEDQSFQEVVSWGPHGDCFVVKDMNEFTKAILPRMFKHSNFASFVRQLNKYDFHKVKNTDDNTFGEHSWTFRHPDFHADRRDALENIKRKVPASRKSQNTPNAAASTTRPMGSSSSGGMPAASGSGSASGSPGPFYGGNGNGNGYSDYQHPQLQSQVDRLTSSHDELSSHIRSLERNIGNLERNLSGLERNYHEVLMEMVGFQRNMAQQDSVMQGLIEWVLRGGGAGGEGKGKRRALPPNASSSLAGTSASSSSASTSSPLAGPSSSSAAASASASAPASASSSSSLAQAQVLSSSSGGQPGPGSGPSSTSSSFALSNENPFVPSSVVAQQIIGPSFRLYSEDGRGSGSSLDGNNNNRDGGDRNVSGGGGGGGGAVGINDAVGRAALMKMSEISRRAGEMLGGSEPVNGGGMFGFADGGGGGGGERPPSRLWTAAANAGLINADGSFVNGSSPGDGWSSGSGGGGGAGAAPTKITSRQEALAKIEELQRMRPASTGFLSNAAAKLVNAMETYGSGVSTKMSRQQQDGETGSLRENTPYSSLSDDSSEDVVMPSASTMAANAAEPNQQQQRAQQLPQDSRSNDTGAEQWNMTLPSVPPLSSYSSQDDPSSSSQSQSQQQPDQSISQLSMLNPFPDYTSNHEGLQVYTVGHLMPKSAIDDMSGAWNFDAGMLGGGGGGGEQGQSSLPLGEFNFSNGNMGNPFMPSSSGSQIFDPSSSSSSPESGTGPKKLRVRRSTFVPGWAVSPRVLLVDDDAVSRKLSSKFLQVFGCKIDVAVDGVGAVNKMNLEKYDLVLMDIVMPKLDGVSATSMIRKFDHMTPIISMTSNSKPNDIMHYYHSGMNDILPKPFTKQGLLDMLEKHLMHLKVIQQMSRIPRSLGIPPLSDSGFEQAITSQAALLTRQNVQQGEDRPGSSSNNYSLALAASSLSSGVSASSSSYGFSPLPVLDGDDDDFGRLNPLAGMGLTDEQYSVILTGIVNGETFAGSMDMGLYGSNDIQMDNRKRGLDEQDDNRNGKRSRFEVVE